MYQANDRQTYHTNETYEIEIRGFLWFNANENESSQLQGIRAIGPECNKENSVNSVGE